MPIICNRCQKQLADTPMFCTFCGARIAAPTPVAAELPKEAPSEKTSPPTAIPRYRRLKLLGSGGMGDVYEAEDTSTGERVALKLLSERLAVNPAAAEQFRNVGRVAQSIAHPRCVKVLRVSGETGPPFMAMELLPGKSLKDIVEAEGALDPERAVTYILDAVEGLIEAHRLGIVHRDVKPSNCLLTEDDRVKIGDFGICRVYEVSQPVGIPARRRSFSGTVLFSSPEQIRGEAVGFDSDIYSICATLYFLLAGKAPHQHLSLTASIAKAISESAPPLRTSCPDVSIALERIVLKGLERDRRRRWESLEELSAALAAEPDDRRSWFGRLFGRR